MEKIGRNDPCSCRSGKKYKKCCLHIEEDRSHLGMLRRRIRQTLIQHTLDQILIGMRSFEERSFKDEPFLHALVCEFALRFCQPGTSEDTPPIAFDVLRKITDAVSEYAYTDPIGFDKEEQKRLLEVEDAVVPLRFLAKQFEMKIEPHQHFGEALHLFSLIPEYLKETNPSKCIFDVKSAFIQEFGVTPEVYIKFCLIAWFSASDYTALEFQSIWDRVKHIEGLDENTSNMLLTDHLSANRGKFLETLERLSSMNPKTAMCGISPLFSYPFVRPWDDGSPDGYKTRITSPVPDLIAYKASHGVYYHLFSKYGIEFSNAFGYIFEEYVGRLLQSCFSSDRVIPESEITGGSKKPDFIVTDGDTAIVVECKAFRYTKELLTDSTPESLNNVLDKVRKALVQIQEFIEANKTCSFRGRTFKRFLPIIVTYGRMYMLRAPALRIPLEKMLRDNNIELSEWYMLDIHELELLEPHLSAGEDLSHIMESISDSTFQEAYQGVVARTGKSFGDSYLYPFVHEMLRY